MAGFKIGFIMATSKTILLCDKCEGGDVVIIKKVTRTSTSLDVKDCSKCGYPHGFKSIQDLKIKKEVSNG